MGGLEAPGPPAAAPEAVSQEAGSGRSGAPPRDPGFLFPGSEDEDAADGCDMTGDLPGTQLENVSLSRPEVAVLDPS
eukprot:4461000-Alexandrium_andersonii.AAC.1